MERFKARKTYFIFMFILSVFLITGCGGGGSSTAPVTINSVSLTTPADGATDVAINTTVTATFNEEMAPATINEATFLLYQGATAVPGTVNYTDLTAVFTPDSNLTASTTYTATITTGAKNLADEALASDYVWTFTTGTTADTTAPTVILTVPSNTETGVSTNTAIAATFSEAMNPLTITTTTFILAQGVTPVSGTMTYSGQAAVFTPASNLAATTTYTATITTGAEDLAGNALSSDYVWTFTTGTTTDTTAPTVTLTNPVDLATGVAVSKKVQATFSESMDPTMINTATFTLKQGATTVAGTVTYVGLVATFTPQSNLAANTTYTATITTEVEDMAGNALASSKVWSFTTVTVLSMGPAPVDLGTADNFVLLSKSGITNTGVTAITGNVGVSPIDSTAITGFTLALDASNQFSTSPLVTGNVYAADYAVPTPSNLTTAISDMETAYVDAAGRAIPDFTELGAGDISGMTLFPGLYKWSTGLLIDSTGVIISGGSDDVWIFQIADDLTLQNGAIVTLGAAAQAKNIFWQVGGGTGVSIGTGCTIQGNILATKAITINTGSTLIGRALAQTNVTLNANTITAP